MKYKILATDMDSTLLTDDRIIDKQTLDTINKAIEKGLTFVLCSGRPLISLERYSSLIPYNMPILACNGAVLGMSKTKELIYNKYIEPSHLKVILSCLENDKKIYIAWENDTLYSNIKCEYTLEYAKVSDVSLIIVNDYTELYLNHKINKIILIDTPENIKEFVSKNENELKNISSYFTSMPYFLEIVDYNTNKGTGLEALAKILNVKQEEIIACGDGYNDLSMIKYAGLGVAVENANDEIKMQANYITSSNNNGGVRKVLEEFVLKD